ncbi:hypothetical protein MCAMS1_02053 [biofilm metagenome]
MKSYTLAMVFITIAASYWLLVSRTPTPTTQTNIADKQEVKDKEPNGVFANLKKSVFKNKTVNTSDASKIIKSTELNNDHRKPVEQEPPHVAFVDERERAEDFNENPPTDSLASRQVELPENWATITQAAITESDPELRSEAIQTLSLYKHKESVDALTKVATTDHDPSNRASAVQALWIAAADNPDAMNEIKGQLVKFSNDADPAVSTLAAKAIADLDKLGK